MQIRATTQLELDAPLRDTLASIRCRRAFDPALYLKAKIALLNDYMRTSGLSVCVVAMSGGVDSALVHAIACAAKADPGSPIVDVLPVSLPYEGTTTETGVTGQEGSVDRAFDVVDAFAGDNGMVVQALDAVHTHLATQIESAVSIRPNPWARGQIAATLRTAALSYVCTLLTKQGRPAILLGTTNRDEGSYLGYFGKYADGAVDVQVISDLHKSEVYALAGFLNVPRTVLHAIPSGDMFDGASDEEVFGVSYDYVELFTALRAMPPAVAAALRARWPAESRTHEARMAGCVEALHGYNRHKYLGRSPAVHLDVLEAAVPGGWDNRPVVQAPAYDPRRFVGLYQPDPGAPEVLEADGWNRSRAEVHPNHRVVGKFMRPSECRRLLHSIPDTVWTPVGIDGIRRDGPVEVVGSYRASLYDPALAEALWERLRAFLPIVRAFQAGEQDSRETDWDGHPVWRPIGLNPLFRFIRYLEGGKLVPHYDAPYRANGLQQTLASVVIYLDTPAGGQGATRFIADPQESVALADRNLADWTRDAASHEVEARVVPRAGQALVFDHRILHDSEAIGSDTVKTIVRTDILFERLDWYRP